MLILFTIVIALIFLFTDIFVLETKGKTDIQVEGMFRVSKYTPLRPI